MIGTILVPLDGSRFAETALPVATRLARGSTARLRLALVHEPAMVLVPAADIPAPATPDDAALRAEKERYVSDTARSLGTVGPDAVGCEVVDGLAGPTLADLVARRKPDLVVMATHGRGPLSRFWLGSVADYLVRHASVPILLLRPRDGEALPAAETSFRRVLVPLDLSEESEAILTPLRALAHVVQAHLTLVHVVEPLLGVGGAGLPYPVTMPNELIETSRGRAQERLDAIADRLRSEGLGVATRVVVGLGVAGTILEQAEQQGFDWIAIATHGAGGFRRMLVGSVADKVIRASAKPVLVLRPGG